MINSSQTQKGFAHIVLVLGLSIALIGALGFIFWQNFIHQEPVVMKTETQAEKTNDIPSVQNEIQPTSVVDIRDLGLSVTLPASLADLTYQPVHLEGDQAVNSVVLSSKKAEAAGCNRADAPLGYLTYDSDKGGVLVAGVGTSSVYYLNTKTSCSAVTDSDIDGLKTALRSTVTNGGR